MKKTTKTQTEIAGINLSYQFASKFGTLMGAAVTLLIIISKHIVLPYLSGWYFILMLGLIISGLVFSLPTVQATAYAAFGERGRPAMIKSYGLVILLEGLAISVPLQVLWSKSGIAFAAGLFILSTCTAILAGINGYSARTKFIKKFVAPAELKAYAAIEKERAAQRIAKRRTQLGLA